MAATANAGKNSMIWHLAGIVNQIAGLFGDGVVAAPTATENTGTDSDLDIGPHTFSIGGSLLYSAGGTIGTIATTTVTATKFGVILVQETAARVLSTKVPGSSQAYDTAAAAIAVLPAPDASNVAIGYMVIEADAGNWVANTDDFTTDLTAATWVPGLPGASAKALPDSITTHVGTPE